MTDTTSATTTTTTTTATTSPAQRTMEPVIDHNKIGWQFVQEYFSIKNRSPDRLHLFYNKNSIFSYGTEGEQPVTCYGQQEIFHRIREFDFQDCKVLISSVEAMPSISRSILIHVLGEISNKGGPSHKFVEAFVLAEQPAGYYVLNDVFRFLKEDIDNNPFESNGVEQVSAQQKQQQAVASYYPAAPAPAQQPTRTEVKQHQQLQAPVQPPVQKPATPAREPVVQQPPAPAVTEQQRTRSPSPIKQSGTPVPSQQRPQASPVLQVREEKPPAAVESTTTTPKKKNAWASSAPATAEKAAAPVKQAPAPPAAAVVPASPPKPKTWATLAATNANVWGGAVSGVPAAVENVDQQASAPPKGANRERSNKDQQPKEDGPRQSQQQRRADTRPAYEEKDKFTVYVKGVQEGMDNKALNELFSKFGSVKQIDIVLQKNIAFVEFVAVESVAMAIGSHMVSGKQISAEERNRKGPRAFSNAGRGGKSGRGKPRPVTASKPAAAQ